jgi:hypothetical protein
MRCLLLCLAITAPALVIACTKSPTNNSDDRVNSPATAASNAAPLPESKSTVSPQKQRSDACTLFSSEEIEAVQGEPLKEAKLTSRSDGKLITSQCFYSLPTFSNSISLAVTERADAQGDRDPKEYWKEIFNSDRTEENEEGEEKEAAPLRVEGIGDEAFWSGSRVGGALYVLKNDKYLRVSIGGSDDQETKIKKLKALAVKAIARL